MLRLFLYGVAVVATALVLSALIVTPFVVAWESWQRRKARRSLLREWGGR